MKQKQQLPRSGYWVSWRELIESVWLLSALSNSRIAMNHRESDRSDDEDKYIDAYFRTVGNACSRISYALQFPWLFRYVPFLKDRARRAVRAVDDSASTLVVVDDASNGEFHNDENYWMASIVELIRSEVQHVSELTLDGKSWPPYSPPTSLPRRIGASFPSTLQLVEDPSGEIRGYALRLAFAFTVATIPEFIVTNGTHAHWFPMTVAFIMVPSQTASYDKVFHRVIGTLLGLGFGTILTPLFKYDPALVVLLGITTYAAVLFFVANYATFTFFITGWVYVVSSIF